MKVSKNIVTLDPEEVASAVCPVEPTWAASQLKRYGLRFAPESRLAAFARCPAVLKAAGFEVEVAGEEQA